MRRGRAAGVSAVGCTGAPREPAYLSAQSGPPCDRHTITCETASAQARSQGGPEMPEREKATPPFLIAQAAAGTPIGSLTCHHHATAAPRDEAGV